MLTVVAEFCLRSDDFVFCCEPIDETVFFLLSEDQVTVLPGVFYLDDDCSNRCLLDFELDDLGVTQSSSSLSSNSE